MTEENLKVSTDLFLPAPLDKVWEFILNDGDMTRWFDAQEFTIDISDGGKVEIPLLFDDQDVLITGEIALILPKEKFAFTWIETSAEGHSWFNNTLVTIILDEIKTGVQFTVVHDGFKYLDMETQEGAYQRYLWYWTESGIMERLYALLVTE